MTETPDPSTILVVDDAPESLDLLKQVLSPDYKVRVAISGEAALKVARQTPPDIILLDVMMPGIDGYEVCRRLKAEDTFKHVPVIFITAKDEVEDEEKGFSVGAVDYITKPISPPLVKARIATHLALHHQRRELEEARIRAEEGSRAKAEFLAMMSHEIRTPLGGILGMVRLLMETPLDRQQSEFLQTVHYSGEALLTIVNDLLDFSKIDAGKFTIESIPFDLHQTLESVVSLMGSRAHEKGLKLNLTIGAGVPICVTGDPLRLRQVLLNLVGNGVKFTQEGSVSVSVAAVPGHGDANRLRFTISDTGIGIEAGAVAAGLFHDFNQLNRTISRRFGGTGLGLAICKRLVALMGGDIDVISQVGVGSSFWFEMALPPATGAVHSPIGDLPAPTSGPLRILLAEDNLVNQKVANAILSRRGHAVTTVSDGAAAVAAVTEGGFDVVLMDVHMPVLDGLEATRRIRRLAVPQSGIPIVALTANAFEEDHQRCLEAGMNDFVSKPINPLLLVAVLGRLIPAA
jgi:CheY-like chemotaxis protein